ncbi:hypothetical protein OG21DRAFT_894913 [Imleria badia]|nr:hypothetical protein OG21DRAFT_894913 [Imleria badia]
MTIFPSCDTFEWLWGLAMTSIPSLVPINLNTIRARRRLSIVPVSRRRAVTYPHTISTDLEVLGLRESISPYSHDIFVFFFPPLPRSTSPHHIIPRRPFAPSGVNHWYKISLFQWWTKKRNCKLFVQGRTWFVLRKTLIEC